jgi:hypothetical protein
MDTPTSFVSIIIVLDGPFEYGDGGIFKLLRCVQNWRQSTWGHGILYADRRDGGMILTGENRRTRRKTCPSATLSSTNPTWIDPGANPGLRGERPATNDLSHGTALKVMLNDAHHSACLYLLSVCL